MVTPGRNIKPAEGLTSGEEGAKTLRSFLSYGHEPTLLWRQLPHIRGTGRIPENLMNITNNNFASVTVVDLTIQSLVSDIVVGKTRISNLTTLHARSQKSYTFTIDLPITDDGLNFYCKSSTIKIHTLFLELQMTMNISYLSHVEQVSWTPSNTSTVAGIRRSRIL
ncbi:Transmembrane protein 106B [Larimichthys crocea]|uniref:Transmembrane protein 106B n=1 Tax=Larimichthys crocea TaxID=215358 RepID=A0A6G0HXN1_LARCR|nr:Transmembrane protein 106B [Larimichthys crocea]